MPHLSLGFKIRKKKEKLFQEEALSKATFNLVKRDSSLCQASINKLFGNSKSNKYFIKGYRVVRLIIP